MTHLPSAPPAAPAVAEVRREADGAVTVTWRPGAGAAAMFAVYRVDPGAPEGRLVGTVRAAGGGEHSFLDRDPTAVGGAEYCVSGLDRSWNEGQVSAAAGLA
jgi:hypothetical protein